MAHRPLDASRIGAHDHQFVMRQIERLKVVVEHGGRVEVVHGHVEKALDLGRMEVHGEHPVGARPRDQVGDELGGDRHPAGVFAVLAGVAEVGDHGREPVGTGPLEAVDHDEQLHQVFVHRRAGGLHDEHVAAADVLVDLAGDLAVWKPPHRDLAHRQIEVAADVLGERQVGGAAEDFEIVHGEILRAGADTGAILSL